MSGIYIHIPFCKKKCIYCNFYSIVHTKLMDEYVNAVITEICRGIPCGCLQNITTIYFGGGTPSLLSIHSLEKILKTLFDNFDIHPDAECTIEGNPEQLTFEYLSDLKKIGFNRLSIGVQSFNDEILRFLGRTHTAKEALESIQNAEKAGFDNISVDLIYGIYLRSLEEWEKELQTVFQTPVKHLSAYSLTVEENTLLHKKISQHQFNEMDEEQTLKEMKTLMNEAKKHGFEHYEVSNFALKDYRSKHNSNYWNGTPYLGFGAAAHSYFNNNNGNVRRWNINHVEKYIKAIQDNEIFFETEYLTENEIFNEYVLLRLRTKEGIDLNHFETLFGSEKLQNFFHSLQTINPNYYKKESRFLRITEDGLPLLDYITAELMSE